MAQNTLSSSRAKVAHAIDPDAMPNTATEAVFAVCSKRDPGPAAAVVPAGASAAAAV